MTDEEILKLKPYFDLGHQGDFDWTQIDHSLTLTPSQRLRRMESFRDFVNQAAPHAKQIRDSYR